MHVGVSAKNAVACRGLRVGPSKSRTITLGFLAFADLLAGGRATSAAAIAMGHALPSGHPRGNA